MIEGSFGPARQSSRPSPPEHFGSVTVGLRGYCLTFWIP